MLDDRIKARILDDHKKLIVNGKLRSRSQFEGHYRIFPSRFGQDGLPRLGGEDLLETMHSLRYYDAGLIAFGDNCRMMLSASLTPSRVERLGISPKAQIVGLHDKHRGYLQFHRQSVFEV